MKEKLVKCIISMFFIIICGFGVMCNRVYADEDVYDTVGVREYDITYEKLKAAQNLYCVARGKHLRDGADTYIVDSAFHIRTSLIERNMSYFSSEYGIHVATTDWETSLLDRGVIKELFYKFQYEICNNDSMGKGFGTSVDSATLRQKAIWKYWNNFAYTIDETIYKNGSFTYIEGIDVDPTNDEGTEDKILKNFKKEASIYSRVLVKNEKSIKASISDIKVSDDKKSVSFKYSGIITGIYDNNDNALDFNLENWGVGQNTNKRINIPSSINGLKIQIASTDTNLYIYHLQNKSLYCSEGKSQINWGIYSDEKMGQDLICTKYEKSDDITQNISLDGSSSGGGYEIVITDTRYNIKFKKIDTDNENGIGSVNIKLATMLDGVHREYTQSTGQDGIASFEGAEHGLYPGTYDVYEQNPNEGYIKNELYVGQIQVGQSCGWIYNAGNVDGLDLGNDDKVVVFIIKNKKATRNITVTKLDVETRERIPRNCIRFNKIKC